MVDSGDYKPVLELTRGSVVESIHFGAVAVVDSGGHLFAHYGNPYLVTFMRSSAKPFQALPLVELGGDQTFHLTSRELAIICASHDGTDEHVAVVQGIQEKVGVQESDLLCGTHPPVHALTADAMKARGEAPTPNRHNCSGKHTGMLAQARMRGLPIGDYINPEHPIQHTILATFSEMCGISSREILMGVDGCSAPNFAIPIYNAALGFARLCDPGGLPFDRANACRRIATAMMAHPDMVGGAERFDTRLMAVCNGRILAKGGAEGYLAIGIMPGVLEPGSLGMGIAIKIADGDLNGRVRPSLGLALLRILGLITEKELEALAEFGPVKSVTNWRRLVVGESRPVVSLEKTEEPAVDLSTRALQVHQLLLGVYGQPNWSNPLPPLDELVSTILSQNTNDVNRDRAFDALRRRFPTWEAVRDAKKEEVIAAVRPAGLANQKGPRIQAVLREITKERGNLDLDFLKDYPLEEARRWLMKFKGVGPKTAAIVLLFSLGRSAFPVDTHIYRVAGRIGLLPPRMSIEDAHRHLESLFPPEAYYAAHLNLIRLGREICKARKPDCPRCPVHDICNYGRKALK